MNECDSTEILKILVASGKLTDEDVAKTEEEMNKRQLARLHQHSIYQSDGRWCTHVNEKGYRKGLKKISAVSEERLYEKLYAHYFKKITLGKLLEDWATYSAERTERSPKTIYEDRCTFNRFIKDSFINTVDITKLEYTDFIRFFDELFRENPTKAHVGAVRTLINQLYGQAIMNKIDVVNPTLQMQTYFKTKSYRVVDQTPGYSAEERKILLNHMQEIKSPNIYDYAIMIMFCFTIRIGELKALKWTDIDNGEIYVCRQLNTYNEEVDIKKNTGKGRRYLPIPEFAADIMDKIPKEGTYIFMKDNKPLNTDSFNTRLKKRCSECGIKYLSSHKIRFSNCTMLFDSGMNIRDIQISMGHTEQRMTEHYNRPNYEQRANAAISDVLVEGATNGRP